MNGPMKVDDLTIVIGDAAAGDTVVRNVTFELQPREVLAIVGESGSGKTLTARAALRLLPPAATARGAIYVSGTDVLTADSEQLRKIRGEDAAMIFQEPSTALNPVFTIGWQMSEGLKAHGVSDGAERRSRSIELLEAVGIPDPHTRIDHYPHQFSGGQKQRIIIAMALALRPSVIIADEPTTALDVTVQAEILALLRDCRDRLDASILLITHNMGVVADLADSVAVMYRGELLEIGSVDQIFSAPAHAYTRELLDAVPRLGTRVFAPRDSQPRDAETAVNLKAQGLNIIYSGGFRQKDFHAVHDVDFEIRAGEVFGLVGESGSGKSTIGRATIGLAPISRGTLEVLGTDVGSASRKELRELRRRVGFVFQDPASSFNPFMSVAECIEEPMRIHRVGSPAYRSSHSRELLDAVQLPAALASRKPYELSGGQRQRVGLARALSLNPEFLIADEPTSALDVSVQVKILELFTELQQEFSFGCLFISHDLAVVEMLADRVGVLQHGRMVESGDTERVLHHPEDEYTRALIAAVPVPDPAVQRMRRSSPLD